MTKFMSMLKTSGCHEKKVVEKKFKHCQCQNLGEIEDVVYFRRNYINH